MSRLLIGNFEFEWSLAHPRQPATPTLQRLSAELACTWLAVAEPEDLLLMPGSPEPEFWTRLAEQLPWPLPRRISCLTDAPAGRVVVPWGWSERLLAECRLAGLEMPPHPQVEVVRRVNSRRFSLALEHELPCGLPGGAWVTSLDEVHAALRQIIRNQARDADSAAADETAVSSGPPQWVLKSDLSHAARERVTGRGEGLAARDRAWVEARLARDGGVACEPWVEIVEEAGVQWELPVEEEPRLMGVTPLLTDPQGRYRGSVCREAAAPEDARPESASTTAASDWSDAIPLTQAAARRIQAEGYFGPLGIDVCRYRDAQGAVRLRPLQDINARWTMGRLALGWGRMLSRGEAGVWRHGPPNAPLRCPVPGLEASPLEPAPRILPTSPHLLDGVPLRIPHRLEIHPAR